MKTRRPATTFPTLLVALAAWSLCSAHTALAQDCLIRGEGTGTTEDPYVVPKTDGEIRIDAVLDEEAWENALVLSIPYEVQPGENIPAPVETEVYLTYDDSHLYAGLRCLDTDPSQVSAHLSDRDNVGGADDWIALIMDTFNDERRSFDVLVNALGVQEDFIETSTGGGSWDAIWDSAGRLTDYGYAVELAIPFNQLRFQRSDVAQIWGFDAVRSYPRSVRHHLGAFPRDRNNNCYLCQAVKIAGFDGISPGRNIEINPTLTGVRTDALNDSIPGQFDTVTEEAEFGVTGRWGMTPNLTFTAAYQPDFSQVEADAFQLDINQPFALRYPERRPFFLEGVDFFNSLKDAIYTRAIRSPLWGAKLSGKEGNHTIGATFTEDKVTNLLFPATEWSDGTSLDEHSMGGILRYKHDLGNRYTLGGIYTGRKGDGYGNHLVGLDGDFRITDTDEIQLQYMVSNTEYPDDIAEEFYQQSGDFTDRFIAFEYDHDARDMYWWVDYDDVGGGFRADLGFIPRVGYRNVEGGFIYNWFSEPTTWWSEINVGTDLHYNENEFGGFLEQYGTLYMNYNGALQSWARVDGRLGREAYNGVEFDWDSVSAQGGLRPTADLQVYAYVSYGNRIDYWNTRLGKRFRFDPELTYDLGKHLRIALTHTYERMDADDVGRVYTANISYLAARYQFTRRTFLRAILQYRDYDRNPAAYVDDVESLDRRFFTQLLFSYKLNPRTVVYLGYTDSHFGDARTDITQTDRTFFAKVGYAWIL
jgi:hypothetical protein